MPGADNTTGVNDMDNADDVDGTTVGDANDWEWVRVTAQGRVYDDGRPSANRLAWAAVALAASHGGERSGVRRARAVVDRFALRARLIRSLGPWAADPDALAEEVMAEQGIPDRQRRIAARALEPVVGHIRDTDLRARAEEWVRGA
ncbi:hypothetical protein [Saccharothrix yanglingensis]|uniref:Uncharacterized protein n=1 Tax=Saccharothrix yanglingensis TaxID=659496 RepID=A0ABU0WVS2_9PSEU|nr:hypothetical protein [Saccharothrix yanglingensis]MDQ2582424.1 hypothetical protein [Saccharothrix yanglingensis]